MDKPRVCREPRLPCGRRAHRSAARRWPRRPTPKQDPFLRYGRRTSAASDSVENATRVRVSRSLHGLWRKAVRMPLKTFRRRLRGAMAARSGAGIPVSVDRTTELADGSVRGPLSAAARAMHGRRALRISDETASAQRQFDDDRGDALRRPCGPRAGDDARASRRRNTGFPRSDSWSRSRVRSGATRSSARFRKDFSLRSMRSSTGRRPDGTREHLFYRERLEARADDIRASIS